MYYNTRACHEESDLLKLTFDDGAEEPAAMEGTGAAGPTTGLESTEVAGPGS